MSKPSSHAGTAALPKTRKVAARSKTTTKSAPSNATTLRGRAAPPGAKLAPTLVEISQPVVAAPALRKTDLVDAVVARTGQKKRDVKPVIEEALAVLGAALGEGRELNLRPLGKLKVQRSEEKANGTVMTCRVRQPKS